MISLFRRPEPDPALRDALERAFAEIRHLTELVAEMKRDGFTLPAQYEAPTGEDMGIPESVMDAIEQRAFTKPAQERLKAQARRLLRDAGPDEVRDHILAGEQTFSWSG